MTEEQLIKYNKAYENASNILSDTVNFFSIYPRYYLEVINRMAPSLIEKFETMEYKLIIDNNKEEINLTISIYLDELDVLNDKVKGLLKYTNYESELELFQNFMGKTELVVKVLKMSKEEVLYNYKEIVSEIIK